ncbi:MAG: hypothetical protein JSS76_16545 [Bacteroidetes bacterium]|nr:hypothetical protein [Bacteroidota bacterium]MBS1686352.1 hypothetical protein [Bacteroidota bacterium]
MKIYTPLLVIAALCMSYTASALAICPSDSSKGQTVGEYLREFARQKYPDDKEMQDYIYNEQLEALIYMKNVTDAECKIFAIKKYPGDYAMQKYIYDEQVEAKKYMSSISSAAKADAVARYPDDYAMQKYILENP